MKIDPRKQSNQKSTLARLSILEKAYTHIADFKENSGFYESLRTQGAFAKYQCREHAISKMSLNTLKNCANEVIPGGWETLDSLRKDVADKLKWAKMPEKNISITKTGLKTTIANKDQKIKELQETNLVLTTVIARAVQSIEFIAKAKDLESRQQRAEITLKELRSIVQLNSPPFNSIDNILTFPIKKDND